MEIRINHISRSAVCCPCFYLIKLQFCALNCYELLIGPHVICHIWTPVWTGCFSCVHTLSCYTWSLLPPLHGTCQRACQCGELCLYHDHAIYNRLTITKLWTWHLLEVNWIFSKYLREYLRISQYFSSDIKNLSLSILNIWEASYFCILFNRFLIHILILTDKL